MSVWETLTVDVHVPADVGVAQCVGDLAGHWLGEERVIHNHLVGVIWHFWNHIAPFGPPGEQNTHGLNK